MDLRDVIPDHVDGILVISDIHGEYSRMMAAIDYAHDNFLYIIFLGDLVDGGSMPFETIEEVYSLLEQNKACMAVGNHDYKWYRAIKAETPVRITDYMANTVWDVTDGYEEQFLDTYVSLYEHENTYYYLTYGKWFFVHAAMHKKLYTGEELKKDEYSRLMYGYTNNKRDDRGFPIRLYDWIDDIPMGTYVVVGHDRAPMGKTFDGRPEMVCGSKSGMAIFTDTGCGKRDDGILTATSLMFVDEGLTFTRFISF